MSVDVRTRVDGPPRLLEPAEVLGAVLPLAFEAGADRLAAGVAELAPRPLTIAIGPDRWTLVAAGGRVRVQPGTVEGAAETVLSAQQLTDLVDDQATPMGWFSSGALVGDARLDQLLDWWVLVRAALDDLVPHTAGALDLVDADGAPLDLARSFRPDDPVEDMRAFLEAAGYLHLVGVFTEGEMAEVSAEMDRVARDHQPGDGRSWWARTADGEERLVRIQGFDASSPSTGELLGDGRLLAIGDIPSEGHQWGTMPGNRVEALFKPLDVVEGISDVPWHKDCSLGRHSYDCSFVTTGISVTGAGATSGQLRVVAGSHRALVWPALIRPGFDLPMVDLPTSTGDVTVHLSCTLHMAQPPVARERRVMYTSFPLPKDDAAAARAGQDRLRAVREAAPVTVSQPARPA